jgi:D-sedoheptulose 7-phosphate isomerase
VNKNIQEIISCFQLSSKLISDSEHLAPKIEHAIKIINECFSEGNKLVVFGNGGSAADAQHIAAELIGRFKTERKSLPSIALSTDTSILTSLSNDYSFDLIFQRQCEGLVRSGDVVLGISTSGNSKNVENGLKAAKKIGATTIALLGNEGGKIKDLVDLSIIVNSNSTSKIQEVHRVIYHIICEKVEENFDEQNG